MRRVIVAALAALCLFAVPASARVAVVVHQAPNETAVTTALRADYQTAKQRALLYVTSFLDAYKASYDVVPARSVQTSRIKDGFITGFNGDTAYSGVIFVGGNTTGTNPIAGCFPCSLTVGANAGATLPTKPVMFVPTGLFETGYASSTACSTGNGGDCFDPDGQGPGYSTQRVWSPITPTLRFGWLVGSQLQATRNDKDGAASTRGGIRTLLGGGASNAVMVDGGYNWKSASVRPAWRDSVYAAEDEHAGIGSGGEVMGPVFGHYVIERLNRYSGSTATGYADNEFAPSIYVQWLSTAIPTIGGDDGVTDSRIEGNPYPIWLAIAHMDSVANGWILGRGLEPRGVAFQVSHGLMRGAWNAPGGVRPDEPNMSAAVDSLAALGIPFAVGLPVLADSLATYASSLATWQRAPLAKFAVQSSGGLSGSAEAGVKNADCIKPVDLFGRYRSRLFYTTASCDTSIYKLLLAARNRVDSLVGSSKRDRMLIAGDDDWSPFNYSESANSRDSLAYAAYLAGFTGIANNADDDSLDAVTPSNPRGLDARQRAVPVGNGDRFVFATFPGFITNGAAYATGGLATDSNDSTQAQVYAHRNMRGLFLPAWFMSVKGDPWVKNTLGLGVPWYSEPGTSGSVSPLARTDTGTNLVRITASSLGYGGGGPSADMPGFYQVKWFVNMCRTLNAVAGRTLIAFKYPGDLSPDDLRR